MADLDRAARRTDKIARTLIRLKHSLNADDELVEFRSAVKEAMLRGEVLELDLNSTLAELDN
jgi:hypothetical protein